MARRMLSFLTVIILLTPLLAACAAKSGADAKREIRLYQLLPVARNSSLVGAPGEGEAIAIINTGRAPHTVSGWAIQTQSGRAVLPKVTLKPGQPVYFANDVEYFRKYWNFTPHYEYGANTDNAVPDLKLPDGKPPLLNDGGDILQLIDEKGAVVDLVAYGTAGNPPLPWTGPPVELVNSFPLTPGNQVITRLKADSATILTDPRAASFSNGTKTEPRRVFYAGQSDFPVRTVTGPMTLIAASAPDNAGPVLFDLVDKASKSIRLVGYQYTAAVLADKLIAAAKRNVKVQVAIERNPGGSDMFDSDKEAHAKLHAGGVEILYYHKWDGDLSSRINPLHAKYGIFDDSAVLVSSGNWTNSVYTTDPSCGNREWVAVIKGNADVVKLLTEIWDYDIASGHVEVRKYNSTLDAPTQPDTYDPGPCLKYTPAKPNAAVVTANATVTRVLSPDNTLDRENGFLGLLRSAKRELLINANYIYKWWGPASAAENLTRYPQPYLQEILAAARRGVEVKVLLDRRNVRLDSLRDNHHVVQYLNEVAQKENLKLQARLINMDQSGVGRTYHNKSFIVDDAVVLSSINGSENSFRYAREVALRIAGAPEFTRYYRDLFLFDWDSSAKPNYPWNLLAIPRSRGTFIDWVKNAELDVDKYELLYRPNADSPWQTLATVDRPGYEDSRQSGIWGVVAITDKGVRSNIAEISR